MQEGLLVLYIFEINEQRLCYRVYQTFQGEEILFLTPDTDADSLSLIGILGQRQILRDEFIADLVYSAFQTAVLLVAADRMDHLRSQSGTHQGQILVDRVDQTDRMSLRCILGQT